MSNKKNVDTVPGGRTHCVLLCPSNRFCRIHTTCGKVTHVLNAPQPQPPGGLVLQHCPLHSAPTQSGTRRTVSEWSGHPGSPDAAPTSLRKSAPRGQSTIALVPTVLANSAMRSLPCVVTSFDGRMFLCFYATEFRV